MQSPIRSTVRAVQQFLSDGSNVLASLMVVSLFVVIIALLLPLGSLFNVPAKATANDISSPQPYMRERQGEDVSSVEQLQQRRAAILKELQDEWQAVKQKFYADFGPAVVNMQQRQEELKEQWLERRVLSSPSEATIVSTGWTYRFDTLKGKWIALHFTMSAAGPVIDEYFELQNLPDTEVPAQRQEELKDQWFEQGGMENTLEGR